MTSYGILWILIAIEAFFVLLIISFIVFLSMSSPFII